MTEITHIRKFNWKNWIIGVSRWFSIITIFWFVTKIGIQNGVFDDPIMTLIAVIGFMGYIVAMGLKLVDRDSKEYWIYEENNGKEE